MARETKVGLLAGLAFIICFAVILANRGRQDLRSRQMPYVAEYSPAAPGRLPRSDVAKHARRGIESAMNGAVRRRGKPSIRRTPRRGDVPDGATARRPGANPARGAAAAPGQREGPVDTAASAYTPPAGRTGVALTAPNADGADRVKILEQRLDQLARSVEGQSGQTTVRPPARRREPVPQPSRGEGRGMDVGSPKTGLVIASRTLSFSKDGASAPARKVSPSSEPPDRVEESSRRHTVASGDTLTSIAARYYGSRARRIIEGIYDANRSRMPGPDQLRVGIELSLPVVSGYDGPSRVGGRGALPATPSVPTARDVKVAAPRPARWYQIRKNDRYITIAREQLGDARRWKEIYELNKDKFPDAGFIRAGVRIKLPPTEVAGARGTGR